MNRVDPLREGSGESVSSQLVRRFPRLEVPKDFFQKIFPYQRLGYSCVAFLLQNVPFDIEAHDLGADRITDVKLFIFQP